MFKDNSGDFLKNVREKISENMENLSEEYQEDLKRKLDVPPPRTGRIYYNIGGKDVHVASAEGEPPAPLTRALIDSIENTVENRGRSGIYSYAYSDKDYAVYLELGTVHIDPRPAWGPVLTDNKDKYAEIATEGFKRRR